MTMPNANSDTAAPPNKRLDAAGKALASLLCAKRNIFDAQDAANCVEDDDMREQLNLLLLRLRSDIEATDRLVSDYRASRA